MLVVCAPYGNDQGEARDRSPPCDGDIDGREQPAEEDLGGKRLPERLIEDGAKLVEAEVLGNGNRRRAHGDVNGAQGEGATGRGDECGKGWINDLTERCAQ